MSIKSGKNRASQSEQVQRFLVVGDWVVDEHWVIGVHRSPTSSRVGQAHYRALHVSTSTVESLCGAGRTASVLSLVKQGEKSFCDVLGIGVWHEKDTGALTAMLNPDWSSGQTPHQVSRLVPSHVNEEKLFNLNKVFKKQRSTFGTTRMIRIYQHTGSKFDLLQRIDWELQIHSDELNGLKNKDSQKSSGEEVVWIRNEKMLNRSSLERFLDKNMPTIRAVVIKDMRKGVVSEALIKWLVKRFKQIPWFISTKAWQPEWFDTIKEVDVRLLVIPQISAQWAVRNGVVSRWITRSGEASYAALERIEEIGEKFSNAIIIALPDGLSVLARDRLRPNNDKRLGMIQTDSGPRPLAVGMPMASVFFPALIANLIKDNNIELSELLKNALSFTHKWMSIEVKRIEDPEGWRPDPEQMLQLEAKHEHTRVERWKLFEGNWKDFLWEEARDHWKQAFSEYGVIQRASTDPEVKLKNCLELWRAMIEVDGYVCCVESKRRILHKVINELGAFDAKGLRDHKSCMFIASPGSGKTFLVRRLAETLGLRYLGFNITQMLSKSDLLDCFDTIVTNQAQNREQPLLVFVDEINAKLDGQHVYDAFLAPLEEHVYVRAGKTFHIDPCVWVFAGTERPIPENDSNWDKSDKASDFESRLTIGPLDLRIKGILEPFLRGKLKQDHHENEIRQKLEDETRLEKVYLGVYLLRTIFPDVRRVSFKVLQAFHTLPPSIEARLVRHFVESFIDIQYGEVRARNINKERLKQLCGNIKNWSGQPEKESDMIEIRG